MSVHEPPQFTPAQVLEAGRRAEVEGRTDLALKFFRHLVEQYPGSVEAIAAQGGLGRMRGPAPALVNGQWSPQTLSGIPGDAQRHDPPTQPPLVNPFEAPRGPNPGFDQPGFGQQTTGQWQQPYPQQPAPPEPHYGQDENHPEQPSVELPRLHQDYRTGRFIAALVTWLGALLALVGLGLVPIAVLSPRSFAGIPVLGNLVAGPMTGSGLVAGGLSMLVLGQLVRALLDQANATRDMAAIARAEAEARHGKPARSRRGR